MSNWGSNGKFIKAAFFRIPWALAFLIGSSCFAQQPNQLVYLEGTTQKADGSALAGVSISFSNGLSVVTNESGHYFAFLPLGFTGSSTPSLSGFLSALAFLQQYFGRSIEAEFRKQDVYIHWTIRPYRCEPIFRWSRSRRYSR